MIRVTIEIVPKGNEAAKETLGVMEIVNDGTGSQAIGHYNGRLKAEYTKGDGRRGRVTHFVRQRQSVWSLVGAFLRLWGHADHSPKNMTEKTQGDLFGDGD